MTATLPRGIMVLSVSGVGLVVAGIAWLLLGPTSPVGVPAEAQLWVNALLYVLPVAMLAVPVAWVVLEGRSAR